jgi:hypothetical protein
VLNRPATLTASPDLIGFGHAQMAEGAFRLAFLRAALAAVAGPRLPAAIIGPESGPLAVRHEFREKPVSAIASAHRTHASESDEPTPKDYRKSQRNADLSVRQDATAKEQQMSEELGLQETRELLLGTWIGVALLVEMLVAKELISREELLLLLGDAEDAVCRERRTSLAGLRMLIERGFG